MTPDQAVERAIGHMKIKRYDEHEPAYRFYYTLASRSYYRALDLHPVKSGLLHLLKKTPVLPDVTSSCDHILKMYMMVGSLWEHEQQMMFHNLEDDEIEDIGNAFCNYILNQSKQSSETQCFLQSLCTLLVTTAIEHELIRGAVETTSQGTEYSRIIHDQVKHTVHLRLSSRCWESIVNTCPVCNHNKNETSQS